MSVPAKFRQLGTFYKYYSGEAVAPYPTIFIGGNHEAANYLWELYHGGWAAPNIYFMGYAGACHPYPCLSCVCGWAMAVSTAQQNWSRSHSCRLPCTAPAALVKAPTPRFIEG